jgi:hypothetical protein
MKRLTEVRMERTPFPSGFRGETRQAIAEPAGQETPWKVERVSSPRGDHERSAAPNPENGFGEQAASGDGKIVPVVTG